jgi:hypothetical protein
MPTEQTGSYVRKFSPIPYWILPNENPSGPYVENLTSTQVKLYWTGGVAPFKIYTGTESGSLNVLLEQENSPILLSGYASGQTRYFAVGSFGRINYGNVIKVTFP